MTSHTLPMTASDAPDRSVSYRLVESLRGSAVSAAKAEMEGLDEMVGPYREAFAYGAGCSRSSLALIEGLVRFETYNAALEAMIPVLWRELSRTGGTIGEDDNKQRMDILFGLDGAAGLLGTLKRYRRIAATALTGMTGAQQADFLGTLVAFADRLLPQAGALDLWAWRLHSGAARPSAALALPLYLQTLALVVLVLTWISELPGAWEQHAIRRHIAFLTGRGLHPSQWSLASRFFLDGDRPASATVHAAAEALAA